MDCEPRYRQDAKTQRITKISIPWERHASHLHHKDTKTRRFHTGKNVVDLRVFVVRFFGCGCCRGQRNGLDLGVCVVDAALAVQLESQPSLVGQFQPVRFRDVFPIHPDTGVGAVGYETHQAPLAITAASCWHRLYRKCCRSGWSRREHYRSGFHNRRWAPNADTELPRSHEEWFESTSGTRTS